MTNIADLVGRILISALFLLNGIFKINNYDGTIGWMESFGMPGVLLIPAIILEIVGPVLIIIGYKTKLASGLLSLFCIATAVIFHNDFTNQMQFTSFLKNIALAGGFLILFVNGAKGIMASGDVQWMKTGRGIIHSEMPAMKEGRLHGFQLWINMPAKLKMLSLIHI